MERLDFATLVDVSQSRRKPLVIAHRGASREAPENTLPAFQRALELGAGGIELDVLLTSDKVPIITHNDDLSILTHFHGYAHATPFETLRGLDVGSHFSAATAGQTMPTLAEVLEMVARYDVTTIVEIKSQPGMKASAAQLIGGMVSDIRMRGPVVVSSSCKQIIHELKNRHSKVSRAMIIKRRPFPFFATAFFAKYEKISALHSSLRSLSPHMMEKIKALGCEVHAWTVNEPDEFDLCIELGVDGIITDDVAYAKQRIDAAFGASRS
ncbi:MAG: glycerophosphodiester phosphodiesterase [bacterium]